MSTTYTALHGFSLGSSRPNVAAGTELVTGVDISEEEGLSLLAQNLVRLPLITGTATTLAQAVAAIDSGYQPYELVPVEFMKGITLANGVHSTPPVVTYTDPENDDYSVATYTPGSYAVLPPQIAMNFHDVGIATPYPTVNVKVVNGNDGAVTAYTYAWVRLGAGNRAYLVDAPSLAYLGINVPATISGNGIASNTQVTSSGYDGNGHYLQMSTAQYSPLISWAQITGTILQSPNTFLHPVMTDLSLVFTPSSLHEIDTVMAGWDLDNDFSDVTENVAIDVGTGVGIYNVSELAPDPDWPNRTYHVSVTYQASS